MKQIVWEELPEQIRSDAVRPYYDYLRTRKTDLFLKRLFDVFVSLILILVLLPVFAIIAILIKLDSSGPIFYRQIRVTQYDRDFRIFKFRTMVVNADKIGSLVTTKGDSRITRVGRVIRRFRLDELPQLFNVFTGDMTFVGTRPEVRKYVNAYSDEMMATLLLPAGVTSEASIRYKDEDKLLVDAENVDRIYINNILPEKMHHNLKAIREYSFWKDLATMCRTVLAVMGKDY